MAPPLGPGLKGLSAIAVEAFGRQLAEAFVARLAEASRREPSVGPRSISDMAVQQYIAGSAFGAFGAHQVEAWATDELQRMDPRQARLVLGAAAATSDGTVADTMRNVVKHLSTTRPRPASALET